MYKLTPEEKQKIYAEEKARLEAQEQLKAERATAESQPKPTAQPQRAKRSMGCGTFLMILVGLIAVGVVMLLIQAGKNSGTSSSRQSAATQAEHQFIDYTVLRRWVPGRDGTGLELLVSPTATRTEVMQLAYHLTEKYKPTGFVVMFIFDDRTAWANRQNDSFPEKEFWKHSLVNVMSRPDGGVDVRWTAEGREDPKPPQK